MGGYTQAGMTRTLDVATRFARPAYPTYLRRMTAVAQTASEQEYADLGFQVSASGQNVDADTLIDPPPVVKDVSLRDIGLNSAILPFGSKKFQISQTWVKGQQQSYGYLEPGTGLPDYYRVFRDPSVIGLYYMSRLFKIVSILPEMIGQDPCWWFIIGAFQEQPVIP